MSLLGNKEEYNSYTIRRIYDTTTTQHRHNYGITIFDIAI